MPVTVVIIDPDHESSRATAGILESAGFRTLAADSLEAGMAMIADSEPDIVLLEAAFPEGKCRGLAAAGEIRKSRPNLPLIVLTSLNRDYAFGLTADDVDADELVNKPVKAERLVEAIKRHTS